MAQVAAMSAAAPAAPAATIDLTYSLRYLGETGSTTYPCRYAYYELWRQDGSEVKVRSGYADSNGAVSLSGVASGNLKLIFWTNDGTTCRVDNGATIYSWNSGYTSITSSGAYTLTATDANRGAWSAYSVLQDGYYWLKDRTGWSRSAVSISWPVESWPHSHGNEIDLVDAGRYTIWDRGVVLHEYAHCIQYVLPGGWPSGSGPNPHYIWSESSLGFALLEGWAEFLPAAVDDAPNYFGTDLEDYPFADHMTSGNWDGAIVEGAVAAILWDIYDGASTADHTSYDISSYGDQVDNEFDQFWSIFSTARPTGITSIWSNWPSPGPDLWAIFYYSRINMDTQNPTNPTGTATQPSYSDWVEGMEVTVTLQGATDGVSGIWGYHYLWSSSPTDPTDQEFSVDESIVSLFDPAQGVLSVRTLDRAGRAASTWTSFIFYMDSTPPANPTSITSDHAVSEWSKVSDIIMQWSGATDVGSGVNGYSVLFDNAPNTLPDTRSDTVASSYSTHLADGTWYFHIRTVDNVGNWAPTLTARATGDLWSGTMFLGPVTISISAEDANSGVDRIEYREGAGIWTRYSGPLLRSMEASYLIEARTMDLAGNLGATTAVAFSIDMTPPEAPIGYATTVLVGPWSNALSTDLNWWGANDAIGILGYSYVLTTDPSIFPDGSVDVTGAALIGLPLPEGIWYLNLCTVDGAGHVSVTALSMGPFRVDRTPPETAVAVLGPIPQSGWYTGPVECSVMTQDLLSGISATELRMDGGEWVPCQDPFVIYSEGSHLIEYRSIDNAGNVEDIASLTIAIDLTPPGPPQSASSSLAPGAWVNVNASSLSWTGAWDGTSGIAGYRLAIAAEGGAEPDAGPFFEDNSSRVDLQDGIWNIYLWSVDRAGLFSTAPLVIGPFLVDTLSPGVVAMVAEGTEGLVGWYRSEVSISMLAEDAWSGIAAYEVSINGGEWVERSSPLRLSLEGTYEIKARAVDGAGNIGPVEEKWIGLDLTAPSSEAILDRSPVVPGWWDAPFSVTFAMSDALSPTVLHLKMDQEEWRVGIDALLVEEGEHLLSFYATDAAGNMEELQSLTIRVDATAPLVEGSASVPLACIDSIPEPLRLSASISDLGSALQQVSFAIRFGDGAWSDELSGAAEGALYSVMIAPELWMANIGSDMGWKVMAIDAVGHSTEMVASSLIQILDDDILPPAEPEVVLDSNYSISFHSSDQSGWAVDLWYFFSAAVDAVSEVALMPDPEGKATFALTTEVLREHLGDEIGWRYQLRDLDADRPGDAASLAMSPWASMGPIADTTPPSSQAALVGTAANQWYNSTPTLSLTASDGLSGPKAIWVQVDGLGWNEYVGPLRLADGTHRVLFYAEDLSGNLEEPQELIVQIDTAPPQVMGSLSTASAQAGWRNLSTAFTVEAVDQDSGVSLVEFSLDGGSWTNYTVPVLLEDGRHILRYRAMDGAGNTFAPVELRADIDTSSPTSELQVTVSGNRATVNVTAVDPLSGLDVMLLSVDGKTPYPLLGSPGQVTVDLAAGAHIITLMVTDVAGNEVTRSVE
ncbi:MAG: hypothetical protein WCK39_05340, partial [Methanomassiliicoccales archaeon]